MQKRWVVRQGQPIESLQKALHISPLLSLILANRGITSPAQAHDFLHGTLLDLESPWRIKNMDRVVSRIKQAIAAKEKILVWGDYDVDGTTGTATLFLAIQKMKGMVNTYIPHRIHDGYGLNLSGIQQAAADQVKLLITVDSGVTAKEEIQFAAGKGIDVIVVDHHEPQKEKWPHEAIVINPLQEGCPSSFKYMTAAGLAFKLAWALLGREAFDYLELAAAGTVADMGPLVGENRILVRAGLDRMNKTPRAGFKALLAVAGMAAKKVDAGHLGFVVGPRINAAGRMSSAEAALKLLTTQDLAEAAELAGQLDRENKARQKIEQVTVRQAVQKVNEQVNFQQQRVIVVEDERWHPGVIGIVAARLVDRFYRPSIVIALKDGKGKGSGRSIRNFHLVEALQECESSLEEFGGHKQAAGLTVTQEKLAGFKEELNRVAHQRLKPEDLVPLLEADGEIGLSELNQKFFEELELLAPYGFGNQRPVFFSKSVQIKSPPEIVGANTLRFRVSDGKQICQAIGFGKGDWFSELRGVSTIDLAYTPSLNEWQGERFAELKIEDIKIPL